MAKGKDRDRKADIAACILAGGKNSRMNGRKKAFLPVEETVFWKKIAAKLSGCSAIYISVEDRKKYEQIQADVGECGFEGFPLVEDLEKEKGPLGGIYSVLTACEEQAVLFVPCDMPEVDQELVDTMRGEWVRERKPVFLIRDGKRCPFPGIYTKEMLPWIRRQLERKDYKLQNLLNEIEEKIVCLEDERDGGGNINTEEEYRAYLSKIERKELVRISLKEAVEKILEEVRPLDAWEELPLLELSGRTLWEDVYSRHAQPPFPRSPLDGYAIRSQDSIGADDTHGVFLHVIDTIYAGEASGKKVGEKEAVRLMIGAPIPQGADTVIRQEDVERVGDTISVFQEQHAYENYCYAGEDYSAGTCLLTRGETVGAAECGLLASMGYSHAKVVRNVRAAVIATGSELTEPGSELSFGKIYNANLYLVCSRLTELGVSVVWMDTVQDDARCLKDSIEKACRLDADLILTIGGVSVGQKDIVEETYGLLGAEICFHGVRMKPGSPMMGGSYQKIPMLSFSGNPYGTFVNMELFVLPVLEKMTGSQRYRVEYREGTLAETFEKTGKVPRFVRARWENGTVVWKRQNASGILSSLNGCNCLLEIPPGIGEGRKKGEKVWVRMLSSR